MDKLVSKEIVFRLSCKSLDGLIMSISVDEFIRMLAKEDITIKKLRQQFSIKTKIRTERFIENDDDDSDSDFEGAKPIKLQTKSQNIENPEASANPIKVFK